MNKKGEISLKLLKGNYMQSINEYSSFADNVRDLYGDNVVDTNIPSSNLYTDVESNQFTNLSLPIKGVVLYHVDPKDYGNIASVNKTFNKTVFPNATEIQIIPGPNYKAFLSISFSRELLSVDLPLKFMGQLPELNQIDPELLTEVKNIVKKVSTPLINRISNMYAIEIFNNKKISNKNISEMLNLINNPTFKKMFNLTTESTINIFPQLKEMSEDEDFRNEIETSGEKVKNEIEAVIEKSKSKKEAEDLALKEKKITLFADLHYELKNKIQEIAPIEDPVIPPVVPFVIVLPGAANYNFKIKVICAIASIAGTLLLYNGINLALAYRRGM